MTSEVIHQIEAPYSLTRRIEVYGDPEMGWYEWRIIDEAHGVIRDTGLDNNRSGRGYGSAGIALRDALMVESGLGDPCGLDAQPFGGSII